MNKILPEEILTFSTEEHFFRFQSAGSIAYRLVICLMILVLICLPVLKVDISYTSRGVLQTTTKPHQILSPVSGMVTRNTLRKNIRIQQGDTLLIIDNQSLSVEIADVQSAIEMKKKQLSDLKFLLTGDGPIRTAKYSQEKQQYLHQVSRIRKELEYCRDELHSVQPLYDQGFIARLEFEKIKKKYLTAVESLKVTESEFCMKWESERMSIQMDLLALNSRLSRLFTAQRQHILTAPVSGVLADYSEVSAGSFMPAQHLIGRIVPEQHLVAECLVPPDCISRITENQPVKLSIDAYPATVFGRATARVIIVPSDASTVSGQPFYVVTCALDRSSDFMRGKDIKLKSGMTVTGMFLLGRKSLYNLLREKSSKLLYTSERHDEV
jgi:HlyD family secretion protein